MNSFELYGLMVGGYAALLAMTTDGMRFASLKRYGAAAVLIAVVWFTLCLAVMG